MPNPDCVEMTAFGRQFAIGTFYNYTEDAIVLPSKLE
jgi:hypothetical protein